MSSKRKGGGKGGGKKSGSYEVGYAKPPEHGKFKPGVSGNPQGRPRGAPNRNRLQVEQNRLCDIINEEAARIVTIQTPDGKTKKITTTQALIRAINLNGLKGQQRAQRHAIELISETQRLERAERIANFEQWLTYKNVWSAEFARCRLHGQPDQLPHPDDVVLDFEKGEVRIAGPVIKEERPSWERWRKIRERVVEELKELKFWQGCRDTSLKKEILFLIEMAEETISCIDLALGGARGVMRFLERLELSDIEAPCRKKRRLGTPYVFAVIHRAMRDGIEVEKRKR